MKTSHSTSLLGVSILCAFLLFPQLLFAATPSIGISEVMYATTGTNDSDDWVEFTNLGESGVDLTTLSFVSGGSKHVIKDCSNSTLAAGGSAIIANDAGKFTSYWGSSYQVCHAAFSITKNTAGELQIFEPSSGSVFDSVSFTASTDANSKSMSLQRNSDTSFAAATPTPGFFSGSFTPRTTIVVASSTSGATNSTSVPVTTDATVGYFGDLTLPPSVPAGAESNFAAQLYGLDQSPVENARYFWNFDDGTIAEGRTVGHVYTYPGKYVVTLEMSSGAASVSMRAVVHVVSVAVDVAVEDDGSVSLLNSTDEDIDIGGWIIQSGMTRFFIPPHTTLLAEGGTRFSSAVLGFSAVPGLTELLYQNGSRAQGSVLSAGSASRGIALSPTATQQMRATMSASSYAPNVAVATTNKDTSSKESTKSEEDTPDAQGVVLGTTTVLSSLVGAPLLYGLLVLLVALIGFLLWRLWLASARKQEDPKEEEELEVDEFLIEEDEDE